ncbi:hypothetical protein CEXT_470381 [Caerostris extrusa]|uniref:Uncharacterized protein n=1 Tax=Caerostris extrusa TaxID=172846 RepID=A0AAV4XZC1_CAEEX|nr:hypothetical protein CEXT_470381 [Caerostris extrusa]
MSEFLVEARMSSRIFSSLYAVTSCLHIPSGVTVVEASAFGGRVLPDGPQKFRSPQMKFPSHSLFDQKISQTHSQEKLYRMNIAPKTNNALF